MWERPESCAAYLATREQSNSTAGGKPRPYIDSVKSQPRTESGTRPPLHRRWAVFGCDRSVSREAAYPARHRSVR